MSGFYNEYKGEEVKVIGFLLAMSTAQITPVGKDKTYLPKIEKIGAGAVKLTFKHEALCSSMVDRTDVNRFTNPAVVIDRLDKAGKNLMIYSGTIKKDSTFRQLELDMLRFETKNAVVENMDLKDFGVEAVCVWAE